MIFAYENFIVAPKSCPHTLNTKKLLGRLKLAHRSGRDSQLLYYFSTRRFQTNRRDFNLALAS
jgi:hypothetical protein